MRINRIGPVLGGCCIAVAVMGVGGLEAGVNRWTALGPPTAYVSSLAFDPVTPSTVYAGVSGGGVFKSTDGGSSWSPRPLAPEQLVVYEVVVDPLTPTTLYAVTLFGGIVKSTDGGATWSPRNNGLPGSYMTDLVIDPVTPSTLYAGHAYMGVYKSTDGGTSWDLVYGGLSGEGSASPEALVVDPSQPSTVYLGDSWDGVLKSTDGGATWTQLDGYRVNEVLALALDPAHPETLYVGGGSGQVAKSTDGGASWIPLPQFLWGDILALAVDPTDGQVVYAGLSPGGLWKSEDGGASWTAQTTSAFGLLDVGSIAIRPAAPQDLLIGTGAGVLRSSDAGASWSRSGQGMNAASTTDVVSLPGPPDTLFVSTYGDRIWRSTDGGSTWERRSEDLVGTSFIDLEPVPRDSATIYASSDGGYVYKTSTDRTPWGYLPGPQTMRSVQYLLVDSEHPADRLRGGFRPSRTVSFKRRGSDVGGAPLEPDRIGPGHDTRSLRFRHSLRRQLLPWGVRREEHGPGCELHPGRSWNLDANLRACCRPERWGPALGGCRVRGTTSSGPWTAARPGRRLASRWGELVSDLLVDPVAPDTVYAATQGSGVYRSVDGGVSWRAISTGLWNLNPRRLSSSASDPDTIYAATAGGGVFALTFSPPAIDAGCPLPAADVGVPYSATFTASGGAAPLEWKVVQGALPEGLGLDPANGTLLGTPTVSGEWPLTIAVEDALLSRGAAACTLRCWHPSRSRARSSPWGSSARPTRRRCRRPAAVLRTPGRSPAVSSLRGSSWTAVQA